MQPRHFLDIDALPRQTLRAILDDAHAMKALGRSHLPDKVNVRQGAVLAMIFEQPSTRTRVSFEVAMHELGGTSIMLSPADMQIGRGETIADTARVLSRYVDAIMLRTGTARQASRARRARHRAGDQRAHQSVPSLPGHGRRHDLRGEEGVDRRRDRRLARRRQQRRHLLGACAPPALALRSSSPARRSSSRRLSSSPGRRLRARRSKSGTIRSPPPAGADCVVTDVWVSMGDGEDKKKRKSLLKPFQVDRAVMAAAKPDAIFMHCLPAHRGDEVTAEVIDGPQSVVWDEAENRLHVQKAILAWCLDARVSPSSPVAGRSARAPRAAGRAGRGQVMASESSSQERIELVIPADDLILPFQADQADVVGRLVKLGPVVDTILSRHDYPEPVSQAARRGGGAHGPARRRAQIRGQVHPAGLDRRSGRSARRRLPGARSACVAMRASRRSASRPSDSGDSALSELLGQGHFAMTIDRGSDTERYQGVVPLEGESLTEAADTYFRQSEQLPTFIRLAVAKHYRAGHPSGRPWTWRAGGLLVQKLTREGGHGPSVGGFEEEDWMRARALAETVEDHELLDPLLPPDRLLYRLFHEEQVRAYRGDRP